MSQSSRIVVHSLHYSAFFSVSWVKRECFEPLKTFASVPRTEKNGEYFDTRERGESTTSRDDCAQNIDFLYSYLILYIRDSGNGALQRSVHRYR